MKNNFYCQNICGSDDSIEDWNTVYKELQKTDMSEKEKNDILFPPKCKNQCFDCMAKVGERRLKTKELLNDRHIKI